MCYLNDKHCYCLCWVHIKKGEGGMKEPHQMANFSFQNEHDFNAKHLSLRYFVTISRNFSHFPCASLCHKKPDIYFLLLLRLCIILLKPIMYAVIGDEWMNKNDRFFASFSPKSVTTSKLTSIACQPQQWKKQSLNRMVSASVLKWELLVVDGISNAVCLWLIIVGMFWLIRISFAMQSIHPSKTTQNK